MFLIVSMHGTESKLCGYCCFNNMGTSCGILVNVLDCDIIVVSSWLKSGSEGHL